MKTQPIIDRLQAQTNLLKVEGLPAFSQDDLKLTTKNVAYVIPASERFQPNQLGVQKTRQAETDVISVVIGLKTVAQTEAKGNDALETFKDEVKTALVGWIHPDTGEPLYNLAGRVVLIKNGVVWWSQDFTGRNYYEN